MFLRRLPFNNIRALLTPALHAPFSTKSQKEAGVFQSESYHQTKRAAPAAPPSSGSSIGVAFVNQLQTNGQLPGEKVNREKAELLSDQQLRSYIQTKCLFSDAKAELSVDVGVQPTREVHPVLPASGKQPTPQQITQRLVNLLAQYVQEEQPTMVSPSVDLMLHGKPVYKDYMPQLDSVKSGGVRGVCASRLVPESCRDLRGNANQLLEQKQAMLKYQQTKKEQPVKKRNGWPEESATSGSRTSHRIYLCHKRRYDLRVKRERQRLQMFKVQPYLKPN